MQDGEFIHHREKRLNIFVVVTNAREIAKNWHDTLPFSSLFERNNRQSSKDTNIFRQLKVLGLFLCIANCKWFNK